jgi:hypothetical protein
MSDLNTLFPDVELTVQGEVLTIRPFTFGQLPKVLKLTKSFYNDIQPFFEESQGNEAELTMKAMSVGGDDLIELIALGIKKPREWFDSLQIDDGIRVATAFLEVNLSFFAQRVLPEVKTAMSKLQSLAMDKLLPSS